MIYLNCAATSHRRPPCVVDAVMRALEGVGSPARGAAEADLDAARLIAGARMELARLFDFDHPERVVFCANATAALNMAIMGTVASGDRVVATAFDHNSVLRPLAHLARTCGVRVDFAPVTPEGAFDVAAAERLVAPGTRLVVLSHASNLTGAILPVRRLAERAHEVGALVLVDCAQTAGAIPVSMRELGADLLAFTGHKALMGPTGTGGLLVAPDVDVRPLLQGGTGIESALDRQPAAYPEHLEAGTLNICGIAGLAAAARFIRREGADAIAARERELRAWFVAGVRDIAGVRVLGAEDGLDHVACIALTVDGVDSARVADRLAVEFGIATRAGLHCAPRAHAALGTLQQGAVRFSFGYYTSPADVDAAIAAVAAIATAS